MINKAHFPQLKYLEDLDRAELPKSTRKVLKTKEY